MFGESCMYDKYQLEALAQEKIEKEIRDEIRKNVDCECWEF